MEDDKVLHFSKQFSFTKYDILFIDNDAQSPVSRYVCAHLDKIKEVCETNNYDFCFIPEIAENVIKHLSNEQKQYYSPTGKEIEWPSNVGTDYLLQYCIEEDRPLVAPAFLRFGTRGTAAKIWKLKSLAESPFLEQLATYLEEIRTEDLRIEEESDRIRFSIRESIGDFMADSQNESADEKFNYEISQLLMEVRQRVDKLRLMGVEEELLQSLLEKQTPLSRMVITSDYRIFLPDYDNMEIIMSPLPKAVFLLFLRHEEGIPFKYLSDYRDELHQIYMQLTNRVQTFVIHKSLDDVCDPTKNAINEKCARIREAFVGKFDDRLAKNYYITGNRGEAKRISLPRELLVWE